MFPRLYHGLWELRRHVKSRYFDEPWAHYYDASLPIDWDPDPWLYDLQLPANVDEILDLGRCAGRNFIPFDGKLKLWGIDIVPYERIKWVRPFKNLTYEHLTVEQLTRKLERTPRDMSKTFVFSSGTLMYVSRRYQQRFYEVCKKNGCKNFIFQEYPTTSTKHSVENFKLPPEWFTVKKLRKAAEDQTMCFMDMDDSMTKKHISA